MSRESRVDRMSDAVNKTNMVNKLNTVSKRIKYLILIGFIALLGACVSVPEKEVSWSSAWPPESLFVAAYEAELDNQAVQSADNYMRWIRRFYQGWTFYSEGWDWLTDRVLVGIDDDAQRLQITQHMYSMGMRISREWAKSSNHRVINTRHLLVWGEALKLSAARDQELWLAVKVSADIDRLLALELDPSMIKSSRYYADSVPAVDSDELDDFDI